ncbi:hypothetical protein E2562_009688 [Oryza meyeriana var. granulata]|uniref:Uncharacterized protein n=1 Tax=Oryza meyeriana var. granulata TaxID=110450 RepID=A0A6G1D1Q6_9ORYZ|nr:hypothetical protein E2562_009688 [Oryza meyeriana var. granulata]
MPPPSPLSPLRATPSSSSRARFRLHLSIPPSPSPPPPLLRAPSHNRWPPPLRASASGGHVCGGADAPTSSALDALLSAAELLCLAPPAICSVVCLTRLVFPPAPAPAGTLVGGRLFVVHYVLLVGAVAIGSLIRRRQWGQLCRAGDGGAAAASWGVDFAGRIGKVEESVRGVVAAVGVLSRTVEKLGVRFRVLRRMLRDPINETATLAQKNSEATRVLAAQEDLFEKELGEIQKVLYAMQEQQQKQLELILAIGEASRILDDKEDLPDGIIANIAMGSSQTLARETAS